MKKIYVGNLSFQTDESKLEGLFSPFGTIKSVAIIRDRFSGDSRGFGFVEMEDDAEADTAIERLNATEFEGRNLTVNEARPPQPRTGGGFRGSREGGGFRGGREGGGGFRGDRDGGRRDYNR